MLYTCYYRIKRVSFDVMQLEGILRCRHLNNGSIQIDIFLDKPGLTVSPGACQRARREFFSQIWIVFQSFYALSHGVYIIGFDYEAIVLINNQFRQS